MPALRFQRNYSIHALSGSGCLNDGACVSKEKILVNVEATTRCSANCSMCPRDAIKSTGNLSLKRAELVSERVNKEEVWELGLAGRGEPTLHPQFPKLVEIFVLY